MFRVAMEVAGCTGAKGDAQKVKCVSEPRPVRQSASALPALLSYLTLLLLLPFGQRRKRSTQLKRLNGGNNIKTSTQARDLKSESTERFFLLRVSGIISSSTSVSSGREDGELSDDSGQEEREPKVDRFFPADMLPRMISKAAKVLKLQLPKDQSSKTSTSALFLRDPSKPRVVPFPEELKDTLETEWKTPVSTKHSSRILNKPYCLPEQIMPLLQVPSVDPPVAALSSSAVIPSEGEGGTKDPCDRRVRTALKFNVQLTAGAFRASAANSVMAQAAYAWTEELTKMTDLPSQVRSTLSKIALATTFSSDASFDALQLDARAMATNVVARRNV